MRNEGTFWVAELVDAAGRPFAPAIYWNGHTRPLFEPVTTLDIQEALKFRSEYACEEQLAKLGPCKRGVLVPTEQWSEATPNE